MALFISCYFSRNCRLRFKLPEEHISNTIRCKLSSTNDYYYLSEITFKTLIAPLINLLQICTFLLIIIQKMHDPLHHDFSLQISLLLFIYPIIAITLSSSIFTDMSTPLKIFLQFELNKTTSIMDTIDYIGIFVEAIVMLLMCVATVLVTNEQQSVLDMLFNFTGLLVVLSLDNILIQTDHKLYLNDYPINILDADRSDCYHSTCCMYSFFECCRRHEEYHPREIVPENGITESTKIHEPEKVLRSPPCSPENVRLLGNLRKSYGSLSSHSIENLRDDSHNEEKLQQEHEILKRELHRKSIGMFLIAIVLYTAFTLSSVLG